MNSLNTQKRVQILQGLVEGVGIRSASRMTGAARNTISKLILDVGQASKEFQDKALRNLPCKRIQCDEIWSFVYAKEKNLPSALQNQPGYGDVWTWTAICPDTKVVPCWLVGNRSSEDAKTFMEDLASRLRDRVQITTDGYRSYPDAVWRAFGKNVDFATIVKKYTGKGPSAVLDILKNKHIGRPKKAHISTSLVERSNLTMRMSMRRFTRKTNAHSKDLEYHQRAVDFNFMYYNFIRIHTTLKTTPAKAIGVADKEWRFEDLLEMIK